MTSFERLVASDPQRGEAYAPRDFDALLARVVATPVAHLTTWRAFKMRVLGAFGASGAVMAVAISVLAGAGPSLDQLTFAAPLEKAAAPSQMMTVTVTGTGLATTAPTHFRSSGLSSQVPSLATFHVSAPSDGARTLALVARVLEVRVGAPAADRARSVAGSRAWSAHGTAFSSATLVRAGGVDYWSFAFPPNDLLASGSYGPARATLERRALDVVAQLGGYETAPPVFIPGPTSRVVVPLLIGGQATNLADTFTFDVLGHVVAASGVLFSLGPPVNYPLISPRAAVVQVARQASLFAHAVSTQGWVGYTPMGASNTFAGLGEVHLATASLQYRVVVDARGVAHAIPTYVYATSPRDAAVVVEATAINPRYLVYEVHGPAAP